MNAYRRMDMSFRTLSLLIGLLVAGVAGAQQRSPEAETHAFNAARALQNARCLERCAAEIKVCTVEKTAADCSTQRQACTQTCPGAISK